MYDYILVRYGELVLKGKNRKHFTNKLVSNITKNLKHIDGIEIIKEYDRTLIQLNGKDHAPIIERLKGVFGIFSLAPVKKVDRDIDAIKKYCDSVVKGSDAKTFKMDCKRSDKAFTPKSDELKRIIATYILQNNEIGVDVRNPELLIKVEIRTDAAYITTEVIRAIGGFPLGVGGKAMLMLSGGIDSPVAAYQLMRKGIEVEFVHFATPPHTTEESVDKVKALVEKLSEFAGKLTLHVIDFTPIQNEIFCSSNDAYRITIMRRFFYRIAAQLAKENGCSAIANGESVGQVASQTLESMVAINAVTNMPVLRPLSMMDKLEIIDISTRIGTYATSIIDHEDCCTLFVPKNPVIKPTIEKSEENEKGMFVDGLIEQSILERKVYKF